MTKEKQPQENSLRHTFFTILGTIMCIILLPILILNISLIVKSYLYTDEVPSIGGYLPLIVLTDSMYPEIQSGDLIFCHTEEPENIREGDVIAFFDPAGSGTSIVTHSVVEVTEKDGEIAWITRGIANNTDDAMPVPADKLVGVYRRRIPGLGNVVMFMQTTGPDHMRGLPHSAAGRLGYCAQEKIREKKAGGYGCSFAGAGGTSRTEIKADKRRYVCTLI